MAKPLNDPSIEQVTQVDRDALSYWMRDPEGSPTDASAAYKDVFKGHTGNYSLRDFDSLALALDEIDTEQAMLEIPTTAVVSDNLTVPPNVTLLIIGEGKFSVASGKTLTLNTGNAGWPLNHIFTGAGNVRLGSNIEYAYARWFGSKEDNETDDAAAIQKALNSFGNETSFRAGRVLVSGAAIGSTLTISSGSVTLESTGWGITADSRPRGFLRWIGSALNEGDPMILVQDCVYSGVRNIRLVGDSDFKPSAAIEFRQAGGATCDQPIVEHVHIGSYYSSDTDTGVQFEAGLLFTGSFNVDNGLFRNIQILQCVTGIDNQNPNASIHNYENLTIGFCTRAYRTVAPQVVIKNFGTAGNDVDIDFATTGADIVLINYVCEGSGRMATASAGAGLSRLTVIGGAFSCLGEDNGGKFEDTDYDGKRFFIDFSGTPSVGVSITFFKFTLTGFGTHAAPAIRCWNTSDNVNPDGSTLVHIDVNKCKGFTDDMIYVGEDNIASSSRDINFDRQPTSTAIGPQLTRYIFSPTDAEDRRFRNLWDKLPGGLTRYGGPLKVKRLATPTGLGVVATGGSGTTYSYRVVALTYDGHTEPCAAVTVSGGASLGGGVFNTLSWNPVVGAYAYEIYGRTPGSEQLLKTLTLAEIGDTFAANWRDTGALTPSGALPTANTTGNAHIYGAHRVYKTDDGAGNAEYLEMAYNGAGLAALTSGKTGTGTARALKIDSPDFAIQIGGVEAWGVYVDKMLYPGADNQYNFGSDSFRIKEAYFGTMVKSPKFNTTSTVFWSSGSGSPEGVVTAGVGSLYTRTDGGAGTTLYVKESGTGNTGWVAK